jgi:hypothetical protein
MTLPLAFHPDAQAEFTASAEWYDDHEIGLGRRFADAVRATIEAITEAPDAWAIWPGRDREPPARSKRRPGYWRDRILGPSTT